jgi:hypothetical protein
LDPILAVPSALTAVAQEGKSRESLAEPIKLAAWRRDDGFGRARNPVSAGFPGSSSLGVPSRQPEMPRIEGYGFGQVTVDGREETRDVIVLPERVVRGWWRKEGHGLVLEDLDEVLDELPEHLVVGTGAYAQMRPDPGTLETLRARGIQVEVLPTGEAVARYGELDPRRTAAALHLTC